MNEFKDYFVIDFTQASTYAFFGLSQNYFVKEVLEKRDDKKSKQLYFRLFRTGLVGDILFKKGTKHIESENHTAEMELLAGLFESYMFLIRTIYDYLLHFLKKYNVKESSFNDFLKKVKNDKYPALDEKFKKHLLNTRLFDER